MAFSESVKIRVLVACRRMCVLCGKFCGTHIELHHIKPKANNGEDTFENCIPLCFDCHADVRTYNPTHAKGTKYSEKELLERRDKFYKEIEDGKIPHAISPEVAERLESILEILSKLFREERNAIGAVEGYRCTLYSYESLRKSIKECSPEVVDELVKWLSEHKYVDTNISADMDGTIRGSIKITQEGLSFYYQSDMSNRRESK